MIEIKLQENGIDAFERTNSSGMLEGVIKSVFIDDSRHSSLWFACPRQGVYTTFKKRVVRTENLIVASKAFDDVSL